MSERRHRISPGELEPVTTAIENQLAEWLQTRDPENEYDAGHLFRLWWRIQHHREGRPDYPQDGEITWGVIEAHLSNGTITEASESGL